MRSPSQDGFETSLGPEPEGISAGDSAPAQRPGHPGPRKSGRLISERWAGSPQGRGEPGPGLRRRSPDHGHTYAPTLSPAGLWAPSQTEPQVCSDELTG